jgi:hypothetical protein
MKTVNRLYDLSKDPDWLVVLFFLSICLALASHSLAVLFG